MTRPIAFAVRLAAAVLATAAAGLAGVVLAPPASAATCSTGSGVSVVVDFGGLGGGVQTGCVPDGAGRSASSLFNAAGFALTPVQNQPGFVCRVNGLPSPDDQACVNTPPEDAYWGLYWSDGTSGDWVYSNYGVSALKVPDGAYVGFAWQTGSKSPPGVAAAPHSSTPTQSATPTQAPSPSSGGGGGHGGGQGGGQGGGHGGGDHSSSPSVRPTPSSTDPTASGTPSGSPSGSPTGSPTKAGGRGGKHRTPSATPSPSDSVLSSPAGGAVSPSVSPAAQSEVAASSQGTALPVWVVPLVILVLAAGASAAYVKRRRNRPSP